MMTVTVDIPEQLAEALAPNGGDLSRAVLQAMALDGYRRDLLSEAAVRRLLGFARREEVHGFLKNHGVYSHYGMKDLEHDLAEIRRYDERMQAEPPADLRPAE